MATARKVFKEVLSQIPADYGVGLRVYAHRAKPRSKETCTDTELVVPVGPLDAPRLLAEMEKVQPRGETPLVYSTLKAPDDLKELGGGSVILITDGEESCGGDPGEAARALKAAGLDLKLDIIGFTVAGQKVQAQLAALAASTGGHYYFAGDGDALSRSLATATFRYPFAVFDAAGRAVARGTADGAPVELKPGDYRISVYTGGQELRKERITVQASTDAIVRLVGEGDRLALE
jgi:hypothetical protein